MGGEAERRRVALVVGTRPEAIKLAPVARASSGSSVLQPTLISTGQHRELLHETLASLELVADHDLGIMRASQTPNDVMAGIFERLPPLLERIGPHAVVVQGDTTTALAACLVAYNARIPVAHVEAGLRTHDRDQPFPEEANRQLVDRLATWCFAPTPTAAANLIAERIAEARIHVTGNTSVDSLHWALSRTRYRCESPCVLLTLHRRESFGGALDEILLGLRDFLEATPDAGVLWPMHPNPEVLKAAERVLASHPRVRRVEPVSHLDLVGAMSTCRLILTDSGGIQEEAPSLGKIVLVARDKTERVEALARAQSRLVGRGREKIQRALTEAWHEPPYAGPVPAPNPFGDGHAGERIVAILERALSSDSIA
jgi:UDP-N-acetylglucosamine 2-epimerase (non-hydrolysing)